MNRLLAALASLALGGCVTVDEVSECHRLTTERDCERASIDGEGACYWLDVFTPQAGESECNLGEPRPMCIGISGTSAGCGLLACEGADPSDGPNAYFRIADDGQIEVFDNPECGPTPHGEWQSCLEGETPPECGCLCSG